MTTPRHGGRGTSSRSGARAISGGTGDWSAASWAWESSADGARARLRERRLRRARSLAKVRADVAAAAARHPSRWQVESAPV